jgi:hypothetical protein
MRSNCSNMCCFGVVLAKGSLVHISPILKVVS